MLAIFKLALSQSHLLLLRHRSVVALLLLRCCSDAHRMLLVICCDVGIMRIGCFPMRLLLACCSDADVMAVRLLLQQLRRSSDKLLSCI